MLKISYNGNNGTFSITNISKSDLKELVDLVEKNATTDALKKIHLDLQDDLDLMNVRSKEDELPF